MKKRKQKDEVWTISGRGLMGNEVADRVESYMKRFGHNAMVLERGRLIFVNVEGVPALRKDTLTNCRVGSTG